MSVTAMSDYRPYLVRPGQKRFRNKLTGEVRTINGFEVVNAATFQRYAFRPHEADALHIADSATIRHETMRRTESSKP